jgi:hypothetical protein
MIMKTVLMACPVVVGVGRVVLVGVGRVGVAVGVGVLCRRPLAAATELCLTPCWEAKPAASRTVTIVIAIQNDARLLIDLPFLSLETPLRLKTVPVTVRARAGRETANLPSQLSPPDG